MDKSGKSGNSSTDSEGAINKLCAIAYVAKLRELLLRAKQESRRYLEITAHQLHELAGGKAVAEVCFATCCLVMVKHMGLHDRFLCGSYMTYDRDLKIRYMIDENTKCFSNDNPFGIFIDTFIPFLHEVKYKLTELQNDASVAGKNFLDVKASDIVRAQFRFPEERFPMYLGACSLIMRITLTSLDMILQAKMVDGVENLAVRYGLGTKFWEIQASKRLWNVLNQINRLITMTALHKTDESSFDDIKAQWKLLIQTLLNTPLVSTSTHNARWVETIMNAYTEMNSDKHSLISPRSIELLVQVSSEIQNACDLILQRNFFVLHDSLFGSGNC